MYNPLTDRRTWLCPDPQLAGFLVISSGKAIGIALGLWLSLFVMSHARGDYIEHFTKSQRRRTLM